MKRKIFAGSTSVALPVFIQDTSSSTGGGLGSLVFNTSGLVAEYRRKGQATWTSIALVTNTLGTYTSGGFIADGSLAGAYEFCPPNAAVASGTTWVAIRLYGAANMLPVLIEIELDAVNYQDVVAFGLTNLDAAVSTRSTMSLSQSLAAARALDAIADTSLTLNDAMHCAIAAAAGKRDNSTATSLVIATPFTGTVLRTNTVTLATPGSTVPVKIA